ncbi:hypothetical protein F0344_15855 [Streptomyces finlayi]|uniref:Uncharacterized protein n=1 Tax=Streptomyces finlayi TaxID=67296 RepID=A0A7G7BKP9_9ACTN|nr:hypothetical protein [Streptomyces finlayi]QNE75914.1 hypothetical protein F0344_15855 [Streptomyces finlayi]
MSTAGPDPAAPPRRCPRGRTSLLIAAAALLGVAGGTAAGYGIQAERAPTPLAALSQPGLAYPAKPLPADRVPDPLPASQDRQAATGGDLRKLLLAEPKGWDTSDDPSLLDGWVGLGGYAVQFKDEGYMYEELISMDLRRVAGASWERGQREVHIRLVQFRSGTELGAVDHAESQLSYMDDSEAGAGNAGHAIKGAGIGRYYLYPVKNEPGYLPQYQARAVAQRGDVMMEINIFDTKSIAKTDIRTLAERQLGRL